MGIPTNNCCAIIIVPWTIYLAQILCGHTIYLHLIPILTQRNRWQKEMLPGRRKPKVCAIFWAQLAQRPHFLTLKHWHAIGISNSMVNTSDFFQDLNSCPVNPKTWQIWFFAQNNTQVLQKWRGTGCHLMQCSILINLPPGRAGTTLSWRWTTWLLRSKLGSLAHLHQQASWPHWLLGDTAGLTSCNLGSSFRDERMHLLHSALLVGHASMARILKLSGCTQHKQKVECWNMIAVIYVFLRIHVGLLMSHSAMYDLLYDCHMCVIHLHQP